MSRVWLAAWILALAAFGIGVYGLFLRFTEGHASASYGSYVPWGLWIAAYVTYVGASAGAFALAAIILLMRWERYYGLARVAMLVALGAFATGMLNVVLDLGHPLRAWKLYTQTSPTSIMGWMAWFYLLYGVLMLVGLWITRRGVVPPLMQRLAAFVFLFAVAFAGAEGALFGVVGARATWESGLTPVLFLVEGALFGLGLVVTVAYIFGQLTTDSARWMGRTMLILLGTVIVLEWAEYSTGLYASVPAKSNTLMTILTGEYWWVFWIFHIALGIIVPGLLLLFGQYRLLTTAIAGALVAAMALASKLNLVIPALAQEELEGLTHAYTGPGLTYTYFPTTMEWLVWLFTLGLGALVVLIGYYVFALSNRAEERN
jgi:molybdopterin-containing oxidoreductase family membrane subunit